MDDNHIKTADLCERCEHSVCSKICTRLDTDGTPPCPLYSVFGCRCERIKPNTPCPYFVEKESL